MDYRTLGGSGCAVSSVCLGTMTFGAETDESGAHQQLDRFIEAGGTMVDTADVYASGRSEEIMAAGSPAARPTSPSPWCSPPRDACRLMTRRTAPGCPRAT